MELFKPSIVEQDPDQLPSTIITGLFINNTPAQQVNMAQSIRLKMIRVKHQKSHQQKDSVMIYKTC